MAPVNGLGARYPEERKHVSQMYKQLRAYCRPQSEASAVPLTYQSLNKQICTAALVLS